MDREAVRLALSLAEGLTRNDSDAEGLVLDAFDSIEAAARGHAYLAGFLLQVLADERNESVADAAEHLRRLLART